MQGTYNSGVITIDTTESENIVATTCGVAVDVSKIHQVMPSITSISGSTYGITSSSSSNISYSSTIGDDSNDKKKIFIVQPWQSKNPIEIENGFWISLEEDMLSHDEVKKCIISKLSENHPDIIFKLGTDPDNVKLVRKDVTLEINKG